MTNRTTASDSTLDQVAALLRGATLSGHPVPPIAAMLPPGDADAAYAVQQRRTHHLLAEGRRLVGRKIGLTSVAVQKQMGVDQPDFGMLFDDMEFADGQPIPWKLLHQPKVEGEIALVLDRDLSRESITLADVISATAYALPAIEVVGSRIADWKISLVDTIADNASSGVYVIGSRPVRLEDFDLRLCGMVMTRGGENVSLGVGAACLGNPLVAALWLARKMVKVGAPLRAGDIVLTGALGPMVTVSPGDQLRCEIGGLGSVQAVFDSV